MEIPSGLTMNSLIWLTSARPDDEGWTARIIEDVETICRANGVPFQVYTVPSRALLEDAFDKIADAARQGCRPLLDIDMHGSIEHGLEIADSEESMSWPALAGKLRGINVATGNNTCVIAASCFAFHAIKQASITRASPFFMLVAPEDKATVGFLEAKFAAVFLAGKPCGFTIHDVMKEVAAAQALKR